MVPNTPKPIPTKQMFNDVFFALLANSMTRATNQATVPRMTIGRVCLTG